MDSHGDAGLLAPESALTSLQNHSNREITVRPMSRGDFSAWDRFVFTTSGGTFFHRAGWCSIFEDVFRLKSHYLVAERGTEIVGVLPLVHQKSLLFGNAIISTPFCVEGGPLALDDEARRALDHA